MSHNNLRSGVFLESGFNVRVDHSMYCIRGFATCNLGILELCVYVCGVHVCAEGGGG